DETMLLAALRELEAAPAVPLLQLLQRPALLKRLQEANVAAACSLRRRAADAFRAALAQLRRRAVEVLTVLGAELAQELEAALFLQLSPLEAWAGDFVKDPEETLHVRRCRGLLWTARLGTSSACPAEQAAELLRRFPPPPPAPEAQVGECEAEEEAQEGEADGADAAQGDDDIEDFEDDASASLMPPIQLSMAGSGRSDAPAQLPLQASGWPEGKNPSCSRPPAEAKNWPQGNLRPPAEANDWPQGEGGHRCWRRSSGFCRFLRACLAGATRFWASWPVRTRALRPRPSGSLRVRSTQMDVHPCAKRTSCAAMRPSRSCSAPRRRPPRARRARRARRCGWRLPRAPGSSGGRAAARTVMSCGCRTGSS
ncbi:unnamed protein product, partial [Effrenium voratum]